MQNSIVHATPNAAAPVDGLSAIERTVREFRELLMRGALAPGQRLIEAELTERLSVSRATLREAIRRLAAERLIETVPNRGARVRLLNASDVAELYQVREVLEGLATRLVAQRLRDDAPGSARVRRDLEAELRRWNRSDTAKNFHEHAALNRALHAKLVEHSLNRQLAPMLDPMVLLIFTLQFGARVGPDDWRRAARDHVGILEAVLDGDPNAAEKRMHAHIRASAARIVETSARIGDA